MVGLSLGLGEGIALLLAEGLFEGFLGGPELIRMEGEALSTKVSGWLLLPLGP